MYRPKRKKYIEDGEYKKLLNKRKQRNLNNQIQRLRAKNDRYTQQLNSYKPGSRFLPIVEEPLTKHQKSFPAELDEYTLAPSPIKKTFHERRYFQGGRKNVAKNRFVSNSVEISQTQNLNSGNTAFRGVNNRMRSSYDDRRPKKGTLGSSFDNRSKFYPESSARSRFKNGDYQMNLYYKKPSNFHNILAKKKSNGFEGLFPKKKPPFKVGKSAEMPRRLMTREETSSSESKQRSKKGSRKGPRRGYLEDQSNHISIQSALDNSNLVNPYYKNHQRQQDRHRNPKLRKNPEKVNFLEKVYNKRKLLDIARSMEIEDFQRRRALAAKKYTYPEFGFLGRHKKLNVRKNKPFKNSRELLRMKSRRPANNQTSEALVVDKKKPGEVLESSIDSITSISGLSVGEESIHLTPPRRPREQFVRLSSVSKKLINEAEQAKKFELKDTALMKMKSTKGYFINTYFVRNKNGRRMIAAVTSKDYLELYCLRTRKQVILYSTEKSKTKNLEFLNFQNFYKSNSIEINYAIL